MKTPRRQIVAAVDQLVRSGRLSRQQLAEGIASYLLETGRTGELDSLMRDEIARRADEGVVEVTAVSARGLSPAVRRDVAEQVRTRYAAAQDVIINERIEPSLIGGMRLELVGRQLDLSVRGRLNQFKRGIL